MTGTITAEDGPVVFATIALRNPMDTISVVSYAISDKQGVYSMNSIPIGRYRLTIDALGMSSLDTLVTIYYPSVGTELHRNYCLSQIVESLDSSIVKASKIEGSIDKKIITITKEDRLRADSGLSLVGSIPQLFYSEKDRKIQAANGENVKILINGATATEQELFALSPDIVKHIEFYDIPPAKYFGASYVINVVTKRLDKGTSLGINTQSAVNAKFINSDIFWKNNLGSHQISLTYSCNFRDYLDDIGFESYDYDLGKEHISRFENNTGGFGYFDNTIRLSYLHSKEDHHLFQLSFSPVFSNYHSSSTSLIGLNGIDQAQREGAKTNNREQFSPSVDLFYSVELPNNQELTASIVASSFSAHQNYCLQENDALEKQILFSDIMEQNNRKQSLFCEMDYSRTFKKRVVLSLGTIGSYTNLESQISNSFGNDIYTTVMANNYTFSELTWSGRKLSLRLTLGGYLFYNKNETDAHFSMTFRPGALVMYKINDALSLRGLFKRSNTPPSLTELSYNKIYINEDIIKEGNPFLKESSTDLLGLVSSFNTSSFNSDLTLLYARMKNPINPYFIQDDTFIFQRYENGLTEKMYAVVSSVRWLPFKKDLIELKATGQLYKSIVKGYLSNDYSYIGASLQYSLALNLKRLQLVYRGNTHSWNIEGLYMIAEEPMSDVSLSYKFKNFSVYAGLYWLFRDAKYETKTIYISPVQFYHTHTINDNNKMITLGIRYRFSKGRESSNKEFALPNADSDSGLF